MLDKTYRPAEVEEKIYALWERSGAFAADSASGGAPDCIMMRPPNVTGSLHIGHALTFRSEERRVGKECSSRCLPYHY